MTTTAPPTAAGQFRDRLSKLRQSREEPVRAEAGTIRGTLWTLLLVANFFLMSNPLVFIPAFDQALHLALILTAVFVLGNLFWIRLPGVPWELLLFLGFAAMSSFWSISNESTWYTVELYALVGMLALLIAANVTVPVLVDGLAWGGVLIVLGSIYAVHAKLPGAVVPLGGDGYMAGVGTNRNILAYTLVLSLAAVVSLVPRTVVGWVARLTCFAIIMIGIVVSSSATGYIATAAVLAVTVLLLGIERFGSHISQRTMRIVQGAVVVVGTAAVVRIDLIAAWVGRDGDTLSGRVPLWAATVDVTRDGPLLNGYGWGAVWTHPWQVAPVNDVVNRIYEQAVLVASHGHNSFLDVLPQLGLVDVTLSAVIYLRTALRAFALRRERRASRPALDLSRFLLIGLVGHLALGLTEPLFTIPVDGSCW